MQGLHPRLLAGLHTGRKRIAVGAAVASRRRLTRWVEHLLGWAAAGWDCCQHPCLVTPALCVMVTVAHCCAATPTLGSQSICCSGVWG